MPIDFGVEPEFQEQRPLRFGSVHAKSFGLGGVLQGGDLGLAEIHAQRMSRPAVRLLPGGKRAGEDLGARVEWIANRLRSQTVWMCSALFVGLGVTKLFG